MKVDVLIGLQWGDEGKGKIVDFLTPHYNIIARFQGGPNAGHTLHFDGKKHVLHTIPSGIFHQHVTNIIGNGVLVDPLVFMDEINRIRERGFDPVQNLVISTRSHLILPTHLLLDAAQERSRGAGLIGSTLRGIGPAYTDKSARQGVRVGDLLAPNFGQLYAESKKRHLKYASLYCNDIEEIRIGKGLTLQAYEDRWLESLELLRSFRIEDTEYVLHEALLQGKKILAEGAQGSMLDVDFGSYPFVTSSNTISAGVCAGLGVAPGRTGKIFGVFKAYCTRVGSGPFPTELHDSNGELMRQRGAEFGATTGRPRRCGWLDLPAVRYANMLNGVTNLIMMKADVLGAFPEIKVCTGYRYQNTVNERFDWNAQYNSPQPVYIELPGWQSEISAAESFDQLPPNLKSFISYIEKSTGVNIAIVSTGPGRMQTLSKKDILVE